MTDPTDQMTQCLLRRGPAQQMCWIPAKHAIPGRRVGLLEKTAQGGAYWDEGWVVEAAYTTMDAGYVLERSRDYKHTRQASDI
jgi:hypothetical protein